MHCASRSGHQMEATEGEELVRNADHLLGPNGHGNEMLNVGQEEQVSSAVLGFSCFGHSFVCDKTLRLFLSSNLFLPLKMEEFLGPRAEYNEEEEERKYYRRKRLGVVKNVVAASVGAMIVYSVYLGEFKRRKERRGRWNGRTDVTLLLVSTQAFCRCSLSSIMT